MICGRSTSELSEMVAEFDGFMVVSGQAVAETRDCVHPSDLCIDFQVSLPNHVLIESIP